MAAEWYYAKNKQRVGPVTAAQLQELVRSGELSRTDMVWKQGMAKWVQAGQAEGLVDAATLAPTPPPFPEDKEEIPPVGNAPMPARQPTTARFPWDASEREKPNPTLKFGTWGVIGVAILAFLLFFTPAAILGLWLLGVMVLFSVFWIRLLWGLTLRGRWLPLDGQPGWVEFLPGNIFKKEDGTVASYRLLPNQRFIDISMSGQLVDSWKVLARGDSNLEVQDISGKVRSFKKGKTLAEKQESFFHQDRTDDLPGTWMPIDRSGKWIQFTKDGAIVFSDGAAGRYTVTGEEPNEVIRVTMADGSAREYRVMSLSKAQLVIVEGGEARTYSLHGTKSTKKRDASAKSASGQSQVPSEGASAAQGDSGTGVGGLLSGFWNWFVEKWRCPQCRSRNTVEQGRTVIGERQEWGHDSQKGYPHQAVYTITTYHAPCRCKNCGYEWTQEYTRRRRA
jgi:hypothetical protein